MNVVDIKHKLVNNGKPTRVYMDYDQDYMETQFREIFFKQEYKRGLKKKNMVVLDIGANIGLSVFYFKDWAKKIYAIEPNDDYFAFLEMNTKDYPQVERFHCGLSLWNGTGVLLSNDDGDRMETMWGKGDKRQPFKCMTIDTFFKENKIKHIDVMKIDCEGGEYPIFMSEGFGKVADKIDYIIGESHITDLLLPGYIPLILKEHGFKVKFLPYKNYFTTVQLNGADGKPATKTYKLYHKTIFEAYK